MSQLEQSLEYIMWLTTIGLTVLLFNLLSKKIKKTYLLFITVFVQVWLIIPIIKFGIYSYFDLNIRWNFDKNLIYNYTLLLAETLPVVVIFGGTTFYIKNKKSKTKN